MIHEQWRRNVREHHISSRSHAFHADMATGGGCTARGSPLLSLAAALRHVTPMDSVWSQADGWAGQQEQTGHHMESLKQGWKADITCILSTTLKPGSDCNVLPANDPTTACNAVLRWYWLNYTVSFELNNLHEKKTTDVSPSAFLLIGKSQLQLVNNPTEKLYHGVAFLNHSLFILKSQ